MLAVNNYLYVSRWQFNVEISEKSLKFNKRIGWTIIFGTVNHSNCRSHLFSSSNNLCRGKKFTHTSLLNIFELLLALLYKVGRTWLKNNLMERAVYFFFARGVGAKSCDI